jgi:thiol-disulfide isomerase/thioredoxin
LSRNYVLLNVDSEKNLRDTSEKPAMRVSRIRGKIRGNRFFAAALVLAGACLQASASDAPKPGEPTDEKARKTYEEAKQWMKQRAYASAIDDFRKANKQDGGHCKDCLTRAYKLAIEIGDYKSAADVAREMLPQAETPDEKAVAHYSLGLALQKQGVQSKKDRCFSESCDEFKAVLDAEPRLVMAHYGNGVSLAHLHQDDAARQEFQAFLAADKLDPALRDRVERYMDRIDLARSVMAPPFSLVTMDGQHISMDGLAGKVVLIDFWATWCGPCRNALPHIRQIAQKLSGPQFVVLSVSLDKEEDKWRSFVQQNGMTWLQYRDGGFNGQIAKQFGVTAIPATFTIDADGVLEDQHVGDADIEGKLKKLIARATAVANRKPQPLLTDGAAPAVQ